MSQDFKGGYMLITGGSGGIHFCLNLFISDLPFHEVQIFFKYSFTISLGEASGKTKVRKTKVK